MTGFFKLFFDLTLYYGLAGYYLVIMFNVPPAPAGFLALTVAIAAVQYLKGKVSDRLRTAIMLLPPLVLVFWPGMAQAVHMLIVWGYLVLSVERKKMYLAYEEFSSNFRMGLCSLLLVLPCYIFSTRTEAAFAAGAPYAALMLCTGVSLQRLLREDTAANTRQALLIFGFGALCLGLAYTPLPTLFTEGISLIYRYVLSPALQGLGLVVALVVFGILKAFAMLFSLFSKQDSEEAQGQDGSFGAAMEELGVKDQWTDDGSLLFWTRIVLGSALIILTAIGLYLLFKRLFGVRGAEASAGFSDHREANTDTLLPNRSVLLRPRNPRLAVRYYYAKYLRECRKRGCPPEPSNTSEELVRLSRDYFPGESPAQLRTLYVDARYSTQVPIDAKDAEQAATFWKQLKRTKFPPNNH